MRPNDRRMLVRAFAVLGIAVVALLVAGLAVASGAFAAPKQAATARYVVSLVQGADVPDVAGLRARLSVGLSADLTGAQADGLSRHPSVAAVRKDVRVRVDGVQYNPVWNLDRIDQRGRTGDGLFRYPDARGAGVTVYVLDTGVQKWHHEISGRARDGWDFVDNDPVAEDCHGHGTHVAGTIAGNKYGVAKKATIVSVRVMGCDGYGWVTDIIAGVDWVAAQNATPRVANMSIGGLYAPDLSEAVGRAADAGVPVVVAAGNDDRDACEGSPGDVPEAITVGSVDQYDRRSDFSNYGPCVDLFAPGERIRAAAWSTSSNTTTILKSGTSMAAPHVSGAAALLLERFPTWPPMLVSAHLTDVATAGRVQGEGAGSPDLLLHVDR